MDIESEVARTTFLQTAQEQLSALLSIADTLEEDMLAAHLALALDTICETMIARAF